MKIKKVLPVFLSTLLTCSTILGTTAFAADVKSDTTKIVANSSSVTVMSPNLMVTENKTVTKAYSTLASIPASISYSEYYHGTWCSGTLYFQSSTTGTNSNYVATYSGTLFGVV